jgi:hypothetical protein
MVQSDIGKLLKFTSLLLKICLEAVDFARLPKGAFLHQLVLALSHDTFTHMPKASSSKSAKDKKLVYTLTFLLYHLVL